MKKVIIALKKTWLFLRLEENPYPIVKITDAVNNNELFASVTRPDPFNVIFVFDEKLHTDDEIKKYIQTKFSEIYSDSKPEDALDIGFEALEPDPYENTDDDDESENPFDEMTKNIQKRRGLSIETDDDEENEDEDEETVKSVKDTTSKTSDTHDATKKERNYRLEKLLRETTDLVGGKEFKNLIDEIVMIAPEIRRKKTPEVFTYRCYLFSIGEGYGFTYCSNIFAKTVAELGICNVDNRKSPSIVAEFKLDPPEKETDRYDPFEKVTDYLFDHKSSGKVAFVGIDISKWTKRIESESFRNMLKCLDKYNEYFIPIFRVPYLEKSVINEIEKSISDILSVKSVAFPPLSSRELRIFAKQKLENCGYTVTSRAWQYFDKKIIEEKSDGRFYGLNTVCKVVKEIMYNKQLDNARKQISSDIIGVYNMKSILTKKLADEHTAEEELNMLVIDPKLREKINEIINQIVMTVKKDEKNHPCIHMQFVGNPGTGKTTVARIMGKMLKEKGILKCGHFHEVAGRQLVGRYIGETAPKTSALCMDAIGSVLFIDEAYSLYRGADDSKDFGREALDTLIAEMENHRNELVVILAGYTDEMKTLMDGNAGLKSRIPYTLEFPNFDREKLFKIFGSMLEQDGYKCDGELSVVAKKYFDGMPDEYMNNKSFGNARFVRNLYDNARAKACTRCQLNGIDELKILASDFERTIAEKEYNYNATPQKRKIGF